MKIIWRMFAKRGTVNVIVNVKMQGRVTAVRSWREAFAIAEMSSSAFWNEL